MPGTRILAADLIFAPPRCVIWAGERSFLVKPTGSGEIVDLVFHGVHLSKRTRPAFLYRKHAYTPVSISAANEFAIALGA